MVYLKTKEEIELMRQSNELVSKTLGEIARWVREGVTTARLDQIAEEFIRDHGAQPGFKGYGEYPYTLCTSVNDVVVHGMPSSYVLRSGDIVSVDCGTLMNGFYGDSAYTFSVGEVEKETMELLRITKEALYKGIEAAGVGKRIGDISNAVQEHCQRHKFSVVREMVGHAIGRSLHEEPQLPNYGKRGSGAKLQSGMVLCLEPMINAGRRNVIFERDGWTVRTADRRPSAHFELCFALSGAGVDCLSTFKYIEEVKN